MRLPISSFDPFNTRDDSHHDLELPVIINLLTHVKTPLTVIRLELSGSKPSLGRSHQLILYKLGRRIYVPLVMVQLLQNFEG